MCTRYYIKICQPIIKLRPGQAKSTHTHTRTQMLNKKSDGDIWLTTRKLLDFSGETFGQCCENRQHTSQDYRGLYREGGHKN